jgi:predicted ArsR family transcriptional regulator
MNRRSPGRRADVLRVLRDAPQALPIVEIAGRLDVHPNTVRFHLDRLVEAGQVERVPPVRGAPGRPPLLFRAAPGMDPAGPRHYQVLAEVLADTLAADPDPASRAVEAGRAWGWRHGRVSAAASPPAQQPAARLVELLDDLGFAPEQDDEQPAGAAEIKLRNCPFLELAARSPQVACPVHLGLMRGALDAWGAPLTVDRLEPFVAPDTCVAYLVAGGA